MLMDFGFWLDCAWRISSQFINIESPKRKIISDKFGSRSVRRQSVHPNPGERPVPPPWNGPLFPDSGKERPPQARSQGLEHSRVRSIPLERTTGGGQQHTEPGHR